MTEFITQKQIEAAATAIRNRTQWQPTIGLVLGSGLSSLADTISDPDIIPYEEIPNWPVSTVVGHSGRLVIGELEDKVVLVQQGRAHYYEGYNPSQLTLPVRVMHELGIQILIVTNAAGGIQTDLVPGDLMLISDHINFLGIAGHNPLRGPNLDKMGPRFPDMINAYDVSLRQLAKETAVANGFTVHEGVYAYVAGPSFETPAELRFLRTIGADAVGMSTVPSVVVARHTGIPVLGIASITNRADPDPAPGTFLSHEDVIKTGKIIIPRITALIRGVLRQL